MSCQAGKNPRGNGTVSPGMSDAAPGQQPAADGRRRRSCQPRDAGQVILDGGGGSVGRHNHGQHHYSARIWPYFSNVCTGRLLTVCLRSAARRSADQRVRHARQLASAQMATDSGPVRSRPATCRGTAAHRRADISARTQHANRRGRFRPVLTGCTGTSRYLWWLTAS